MKFIKKYIFLNSKESIGSVPKRKGASADKQKFALFLPFTRLIEVRELWLFGGCDLFVLVGLVVEFKSIVGISEILFRLIFHPIICCYPIKKFGSVFLIFGISRLVVLESLVVPTFSFCAALGSFPDSARAR